MIRQVALVLAALTPFGNAAGAEDFYRGKTVTMVVGATASGSFDIVARALARRMGAYIPGNPNFVVQNLSGAASLTALHYIASTQPRDGLTMGVFLPGVITQSLVTPEKVKIDLREYSWLGVVSGDFSRVCYGYGPNGIASWDDLIKRGADAPFIMGTTGAGASNFVNAQSLRLILGANIKLVFGFPGATEQRLAVERGELDGDCSGFNGIPPDWLREGKAHPFVRFAEKPTLGVPDSAVYVRDLAKTDEQRRLLNFLYEADKLGRPFVMSRQTPPDRLEILRHGFDAVMKDEIFAGDLAKAQEIIAPLTGVQAEAVFNGMRAASTDIVAEARKIYQ